MKIQGKIYLVGGAVRDLLMGIEPKDRDYVVVGGSAENLLSLGFKQVGADFPVFLHPVTNEEYALARTERKTGIGYNGFTVETDGVTLFDDLGRRDFTINSMAMDVDTEMVFDPYGGQSDIQLGIIRHVSNAFKDDPLRVLRAFRFAARYNFAVAPDTLTAIGNVSFDDLDALVPERIFLECTKSIQDGKFRKFFEWMKDTGTDWVFEKVLFKIKLKDIPDVKNVDGFITALITNGMVRAKPISDFTAISFHKQVAKISYDYIISRHSAEDNYNLVHQLGEWNSLKFKLFVAAHYEPHKHFDSKMVTKATRLIYNSVTSKTVLEVDPTLSGPALGAAIKAARIEAIRCFFED